MSSKLVWNGNQFASLIRSDLEKGMQRAGIYFVAKVKQVLNTSQPRQRSVSGGTVRYRGLDPSRPGQPPKKITGQLQRSISWAFDKPALTLTVGTNLTPPYGFFLEHSTRFMQKRPYMVPTFEAEASRMASIILGGK